MVANKQTLDIDIDAYAARFDTLLELTETLKVSPAAAEDLVADVLLSSLLHRQIPDIDAWLLGAVKCAARRIT